MSSPNGGGLRASRFAEDLPASPTHTRTDSNGGIPQAGEVDNSSAALASVSPLFPNP